MKDNKRTAYDAVAPFMEVVNNNKETFESQKTWDNWASQQLH
jgi:hypothetical protein